MRADIAPMQGAHSLGNNTAEELLVCADFGIQCVVSSLDCPRLLETNARKGGLGNRVTGALVARIPTESLPGAKIAGGGGQRGHGLWSSL